MVTIHRSRVGPGQQYSDSSEVSDARHMDPRMTGMRKLPYAPLIGLPTSPGARKIVCYEQSSSWGIVRMARQLL
jgi:hypothetical protein